LAQPHGCARPPLASYDLCTGGAAQFRAFRGEHTDPTEPVFDLSCGCEVFRSALQVALGNPIPMLGIVMTLFRLDRITGAFRLRRLGQPI
jgi:hypothetical protein